MYFRLFNIYTILIISLLIKGSIFLYLYSFGDIDIFYRSDTPSYIEPIVNWINGIGYHMDSGIDNLKRPPLYPAVLGIGYMLKDIALFTITLQIIISTTTIYYTFKLSYILTSSQKAALISALLLTLEPLVNIFSSALLLTESMLMSTVLFAIYNLVKYLQTKSRLNFAMFVIFMITSVYIKPVVLFFPLPVALYMLYKRVTPATITIFIILFYAFVSVWIIRNGITSNNYTFSSIPKINIYFNALEVIKEKYHINTPLYTPINKSLIKSDKKLKEDLEILKSGRYKDIFFDNFIYSSKVYLKGFLKTLFGIGATEYFKLFGINYSNSLLINTLKRGFQPFLQSLIKNKVALSINIVMLFILILIYIYTIYGGYRLYKSDSPYLSLLFLTIIYFLFVSGGVFGYSRFRIPVLPYIDILAGYGIYCHTKLKYYKNLT